MSLGAWFKIPCKIAEVQLDFVLACGQSFRWTKNVSGHWVGVIKRNAYKMRQTEEHIEYQVFSTNQTAPAKDILLEECPSMEPLSTESELQDARTENSKMDITDATDHHHHAAVTRYFALDTGLAALYDSWSSADERFAAVAPKFPGIRMLQQDFMETLFSFICSSNNNIQRIQQMVEKLCVHYGTAICDLDGRTLYSFPTVERLAEKEVEGKLRELGFGYRAGFVQKSAQYITEHPLWIDQVTNADYATAKSLLMELHGVGAKVADCVLLMSLGHHGAVPVDTHVFSVTADHYLPKLRGIKSVTPRVYNEIGAFYRDRFGPMAGWAHSILFTADLARFKEKKKATAGPESTATAKKRRKGTST